MSSQGDIAQQFIDGGVVPADLVGQETVSKTYVDGQIDIQDASIAIIASQAATAQNTANNGVSAAATAQSTANTAVGAAAAAQTAANTAQNTVDLHKISSTAHAAENLTYNGPVSGAASVKQAIDLTKQRVDNIVASGGTSNIEIVDARQPATGGAFPVLRDRLNNTDAQLADVVQNHVYVRDDMTMAEIQALADSLVNGGVLDFVASANYHITSPISINYENIIVEGNGSTISVTSDIEVFSINNSSNTTVQNFRIIDSTLTARSKYHIHFHNCSLCLVQNTKIIGMALTKSDVAGIWFSRAVGLSSFVNRVQFCLLNQASIVMESTDSWTNNNTVWAYSRSFGIHAVKPSQFIVQNQIIGSSINSGVWVEDTVDGFNIELIKIENNYFDGSYDAIDSGIGIKAVRMVDSIIAVNDFWRQMDEGIIMTDCSTVKVLGNTFKNGNRRDAFKDDIVINGGGYNTFGDNTFTRQVLHTNKGKGITGTGQNNIFHDNPLYFSTYYNTPRIDVPANNKLWNNFGFGVADTKKSVSKTSLNYWLDNVPASAGATPMNTGGSTQAYILGYAAKIVGLSVYSNEQHTAGTLTLTIYKNGVSTGETLTFNTNVFVVTKTVATPIDVSATEVLTLRYATTGWAPTTADISASILIEFAE